MLKNTNTKLCKNVLTRVREKSYNVFSVSHNSNGALNIRAEGIKLWPQKED